MLEFENRPETLASDEDDQLNKAVEISKGR
jgi:hypothetical protein